MLIAAELPIEGEKSMDRVFAFLEKSMIPLVGRVSRNPYLLAIRDAFVILMPFILTASFFGIFEWVILDPWGPILGETGLDLGSTITGGLRGEEYKAAGLIQHLQILQGLCSLV